LPITGTGEETRDFTFVDDIVEATLKAGVIPEALGEAINIASETETKVIDLASMICELTGNDNGVKFVGTRRWDKIVRRRASIEKARKILGYEPKIGIKKGLKKTVEWILQNRDKIKTSVRF
jgi:UDP-glucose 4-epimerase